jgi:hypothetical protein
MSVFVITAVMPGELLSLDTHHVQCTAGCLTGLAHATVATAAIAVNASAGPCNALRDLHTNQHHHQQQRQAPQQQQHQH